MAVITISRQFGAGGRTLGKMISDELKYKFLDDVIILEITKEAKVSTSTVKSIERIAGGKLSSLFSGLLNRDYMDKIVGTDKGYLDEQGYIKALNKVIKDLAKQDNIVLMGRGGQYILSDFENAYHFLLVSDMKHRVEFIQQYYDLDPAKAEKAVNIGEKKRTILFKKMHHKNYNSSSHYHLTLNMSMMSLETAMKTICAMLESS